MTHVFFLGGFFKDHKKKTTVFLSVFKTRVICFFIFADETCDLGGTAHLFFDKVGGGLQGGH